MKNASVPESAIEKTRMQIMSHASALIRTDSSSIIMDPWLVGSCYWRSWWNYPQVEIDLKELEAVDAVVLSHIHWDHWHGPSLKKFFRGKRIIIGDDPNTRSARDLKSIGFDDITVVRHGDYVAIGNIKVHFYNFGLLLNDSALVIETPDSTILNANDAKLAGASLKYLVSRHSPIDIAMRSHSSANSRVCYSVADTSVHLDDRDHYFKSFRLFMDAVKPRYALPFASNHCHLLPEVDEFNAYISKPSELEDFLNNADEGVTEWKFVRALPGSKWDSDSGFDLANQDAFIDYEKKLAAYRDEVSDRLEFFSKREERVQIDENLLRRFETFCRGIKINSQLYGIRFVLTRPGGCSTGFIASKSGCVLTSDISRVPTEGMPLIIMPAVIFRDALVKNMFHHAGISKRCRYMAANRYDLEKLRSFVNSLERRELVQDNTPGFWLRVFVRHVRRWRDMRVYIWAVYYRWLKGMPIYRVEEEILANHSKN